MLEGSHSALYKKRDPTQAFVLACTRGDLAVAQALVAAGWDGAVRAFPLVYDRAVHDTCMEGHLPVIQWLAGLYSERFATVTVVGLLNACQHGHLPLAEWLLQRLEHLGRRTPQVLVRAFQSACKGGHMHVARWVLALGGVDIHANRELAFRCACMNGHMRVAKWLVGLGGVDIHAEEDEALEHLVNIGREACRWLVSLEAVDDGDVRQQQQWRRRWGPERLLVLLKHWSPTRDAWMRGVVCATAPPAPHLP